METSNKKHIFSLFTTKFISIILSIFFILLSSYVNPDIRNSNIDYIEEVENISINWTSLTIFIKLPPFFLGGEDLLQRASEIANIFYIDSNHSIKDY